MANNIGDIFRNIKNNYGDVASWAIWNRQNDNDLASNMGVEGLFDLEKNPRILSKLKNNIIMVGLNSSTSTKGFPSFHNFHSCDNEKLNHTTVRNASKIRYAFNGTCYSGAYMTDLIKNHVEPDSGKVGLSSRGIDNSIRVLVLKCIGY
jgi:hypothetical protein